MREQSVTERGNLNRAMPPSESGENGADARVAVRISAPEKRFRRVSGEWTKAVDAVSQTRLQAFPTKHGSVAAWTERGSCGGAAAEEHQAVRGPGAKARAGHAAPCHGVDQATVTNCWFAVPLPDARLRPCGAPMATVSSSVHKGRRPSGVASAPFESRRPMRQQRGRSASDSS